MISIFHFPGVIQPQPLGQQEGDEDGDIDAEADKWPGPGEQDA